MSPFLLDPPIPQHPTCLVLAGATLDISLLFAEPLGAIMLSR
jgi:hypothetical protein